MATQKVKTWDVLQSHRITKELDAETHLALMCEFVDLYEDLQGLSLAEYIDGYFANTEGDAPEETEAAEEPEEPEDDTVAEAWPSEIGDGAMAKPKPQSMVGMRVVYRFPGQNVLSDENGVTHDSGGVVAFTDIDGESWSNIRRDNVYPIDPDSEYHHVIHVMPREAKELTAWLSGTTVKDQPEGVVLRNLFIEFPAFPDKITFAIVNAKKPFVDRFVGLPNNGFEDNQKPTTRLFGEHCFWVRKKGHIVKVVTP